METTSDRRFDPNYAQVLLLLAQERSVERLLETALDLASRNPDLAFAEIWLTDRGDLCSSCPQRARCADRTRCLHLTAARGEDGPGTVRTSPTFAHTTRRIPIGVGAIGQAAATGKEIVTTEMAQEKALLPDPDRLESHGVRGIRAAPMTVKGEVLGVIALFWRQDAPANLPPWTQIFANHIGAAISNARAFEEIRRLKAQLEVENALLKEELVEARAFGEMVGQSAVLRKIVSQIDLVAPTEASVLILGATGTGKELVAREIHRRSLRRERPLIRVNCASIPRDLFESEFFGHVKGAFTGAIKDRAGRFETAEGGTLFLDEIAEVPVEMQSKLLRVLQEKCYERVGDDRTRVTDVRIIAATNRDLTKAMAAGRFREDLYYRLHVFPIHIPTLKARKDDIPLLAQHFVDLSVKELRCQKPRLTRASISQLQSYDWPGNIRELRNVVERAVILARGGALHFDLAVTDSSPVPAPAPGAATKDARLEIATEAEMRRRERENLVAALERTEWKVKGADGAAELLGLKPTTLLARMKKMGLKRSR